MKRVLFCLVFLLIGMPYGFSQLRYEVSGGINTSKYAGSSMKSKWGYQFGAALFYTLSNKKVYIHPSIQVKTNGGKFDGYSGNEKDPYKYTQNAVFLDILPIRVGYSLYRTKDVNLGIEAGWYIAHGIGGKTKSTLILPDKTIKEERNTFEDESVWFDMGPTTSISCVLLNHYTLHLFGEWGLIDSPGGYSSKSHTYGLSVGYIF